MFDGIVAKESKSLILITFIVFLILFIIDCNLLSFIAFAALLFFIYTCRFKYIDINSLKNDEIYAPISGKVSSIDSDGFKKIVTIDVTLCDLHILRSLENGKVKISQKRGLNLPLGTYKAKRLNEQVSIQYDNVSMTLISSMCNMPITIDKKESYKKGEKIGLFFHGEVIVFFDESMSLDIKIGDRVESGISILAKKIKNS